MDTEPITALSPVELEVERFELAQRGAMLLSKSNLLPPEYQNNASNCFILMDVAKRKGMSPFEVAQQMHVIHNKPTWSASFIIAQFNATKRFSLIEYTFDGEGDDYGCTASATELATGVKIQSPKITLGLAKREGWYGKNGSKWQSNPDLMFRYRSAVYMIRTTVPEILLGLHTTDEIEDVGVVEITDTPTPSKLDALVEKTHKNPSKTRLNEKDDKVVAPDVETPKKGNSVPAKGNQEKIAEIREADEIRFEP